VDGLLRERDSPFETVDRSLLSGAYLSLSWYELADRQFAEAEKGAEQGLAVAPDDIERANLNTNLAHALLLQGQVERARSIYEAWKTKPVGEKPTDKEAKLFAAAVLEDFEEFEGLGILKGVPDAPTIAEAMKAVMAEAKQHRPGAAPAPAR
jgi:tetratricopeptide (TPR) repeat protein